MDAFSVVGIILLCIFMIYIGYELGKDHGHSEGYDKGMKDASKAGKDKGDF